MLLLAMAAIRSGHNTGDVLLRVLSLQQVQVLVPFVANNLVFKRASAPLVLMNSRNTHET